MGCNRCKEKGGFKIACVIEAGCRFIIRSCLRNINETSRAMYNACKIENSEMLITAKGGYACPYNRLVSSVPYEVVDGVLYAMLRLVVKMKWAI